MAESTSSFIKLTFGAATVEVAFSEDLTTALDGLERMRGIIGASAQVVAPIAPRLPIGPRIMGPNEAAYIASVPGKKRMKCPSGTLDREAYALALMGGTAKEAPEVEGESDAPEVASAEDDGAEVY